jgi:hypothetical protein
MKTQSMANACPNYHDSPSRMLLAYLLRFGLLTQFDHPSVADRPNYESSQFRGNHVVVPISEQQIVTLDQTRPSLGLHVDTTHERCRFGESFNDHPN